eukprot:NODE_20679_length_787_cov_2.837879.p1 GENE.NODE_20679_length_787_cov_2.837879~~NODE_20679_length_787_cov_2.837879.p1  ORF type:complete len:178 (-),score=31.82 NODE_20679_length_787_cov_2.837879:252-728(-)
MPCDAEFAELSGDFSERARALQSVLVALGPAPPVPALTSAEVDAGKVLVLANAFVTATACVQRAGHTSFDTAAAAFAASGRAGCLPAATGSHPSSPDGLMPDESTLCVICMQSPRCMMVEPCSHLCLCRPCAVRFCETPESRCPMCRAVPESLRRVFW